jgi:hypothetical protein
LADTAVIFVRVPKTMHLKGYMLAQKNKEQRKINILKNILKRINPTEISNVML